MKIFKSGSFYIFLAATLWSFGGVLGKAIPISGLSIAILRGGISAITIALYRKTFSVHLTRSVLIAALSLSFTTLFYMMSNKLTTAANAILLQYTSPLYIILLAWIIYKQKPTQVDLLALLGVGFGMFIFFSRELSSGHLLGDLLGLLSGLCFAGVFFANKLPNANPVDSVYLGNLLTFFLLPLVFFDQSVYTLDYKGWIMLIIMGVFQLGLAYLLFSIGITKISATSANIIATIEPVLNPVWVFLFIHEVPNPIALLGGVIVLATVIIYNQTLMRKTELKTTKN